MTLRQAPADTPSLTPPLGNYTPPRAPWLKIIHEDEHLCVFDKQAGLLTVPGKSPEHADCLEARARTHDPALRIVHRLDMGTSGIIVMARTPAAHRHLGLQFERRHLSKRYIAQVLGIPDTPGGTIDLPLRCDWPFRPRQMVCHEFGRAAVTQWEVVATSARPGRGGAARFTLDHARHADTPTARLALHPITGRSHQLRVHLNELGHPIIGDALYGAPHAAGMAERMLLHAEAITLRHPCAGAPMTFAAPAPF